MDLINGVEQNRATPDTFQIPSPSEKALVGIGDHVKLGFRNPNKEDQVKAERMWVKVTGQNVGTLANEPAFIEGLSFGDTVEYHPDNILSILWEH